MIVDIYEIESTEVGGASLTLTQLADRTTWNTVGASVQAAPLGGVGTRSESSRIRVRGLKAAMNELVALGNHGRVYVAFFTPTEVAAAVSSGNIPNS